MRTALAAHRRFIQPKHIDIAARGCNGAFRTLDKGPNMSRDRMKHIAAALVLGSASLLAQGCTQLRSHQGYVGDETLLSAVQPGVDNKQSVEASLGRPTFTGQFGASDWYYYARDTRQLAFAQPRPTGQYILHVKFDGAGNVVAVNKGGLENVVSISPESDKTPTLGRTTSFFEELFGNIGAVGAPGAGGGGGPGPN
jgi:outer membrane protein assembly factor BamE (lipoprotein component of BamABCDE complex)